MRGPWIAALVAAALPLAGCGEEVRHGTVLSSPDLYYELGLYFLRPRLVDAEDPGRIYRVYVPDTTFAWGTEYDVDYHVDPIEPRPTDGPTANYVIDEIVGRTTDPIGTRYTLPMWYGRAFEWDGQRLVIAREQPVSCEPSLCLRILDAPSPLELDVALTGEDPPLRAVAVRAAQQ